MRMLSLLFAVIFLPTSQAQTSRDLSIYFVDVEGGQATLFVTPAGQSLLIDTGSRVVSSAGQGEEARDAKRIATAAKLAGIKRIDYLLLTHYHSDHVGGVPQLAELIPIGTFIDHGVNREPGDQATSTRYDAYQKLLAEGSYKHLVAHPGETLPIPGIEVRVITGDGASISKPLAGAGQANPACDASEVRAADQTENARSLGVEITFGKLKILDLGDLTWDKERDLMCPVNKLGTVDVLVVSHHGLSQSSSPALVHAVRPRVAIMDNGANKGGDILTFQTLAASPALKQLWQLHDSNAAGEKYNQPAAFVANVTGPDTGFYLKLAAKANGAFSIFNARTSETTDYPAR